MLPEFSITPKTDKDLLIPMFYRRAVQDMTASEESGRPIYREEDYVQIHIPGDKNTIIDRRVRVDDKTRWAPQWQAYLGNVQQPVHGTPLEQWPALSVAQVAELKALHIPTVEVLAELPESGLQRIGMGARELQNKAKTFIEAAKGNAISEKMAAENSRLQEQLDQLQQQYSAMASRLESFSTNTGPYKSKLKQESK